MRSPSARKQKYTLEQFNKLLGKDIIFSSKLCFGHYGRIVGFIPAGKDVDEVTAALYPEEMEKILPSPYYKNIKKVSKNNRYLVVIDVMYKNTDKIRLRKFMTPRAEIVVYENKRYLVQ